MRKFFDKALVAILLFVHSPFLSKAQTAPDFTVTDIQGNSHHLYSYTAQGKYVLLDFFAFTCGPCYSASEDVSGLYSYYGCNQGDLVVLSMGRGDTDSSLTADFADQAHVLNPVVPGPSPFNGQSVHGLYGITGIPAVVLISPTNQIVPFGYLSDLPRVLDSLGLQPIPSPCPTAYGDIQVQGFNGPLCTPGDLSLTLYNMGTAFGHQIEYAFSFDGQPEQTGTWTGDLWTNSFFNSAPLTLPIPQNLTDRNLEYTFRILSVNGLPDADPSNDSLSGVLEIKYVPTTLDDVEDFEAEPVPNLLHLYREATWWSMPKWKQAPYSYGGGASCIMLQGDSTQFTQAYNDEARFTLAYEWDYTPILGDTPRVVFDVACGVGNALVVVEMGNHCDNINPVMGYLPTASWATSGMYNFFPSGPADWRTVSVDIPPSFLTNSAHRLYIQWNLQVGVPGTMTPNLFIDNIRFSDLLVSQALPQDRSDVQIWPNPGHSELFVDLGHSQGGNVRLFSQQGCLVGEWQTQEGQIQIPLEGISAGMYLVQIQTEQGLVSKRWVRE